VPFEEMIMMVKVRFFGILKNRLGKDEINLTVNTPCNINDIIGKLIEIHKEIESEIIDPELNSPFPNTLIMLNGVEVKNLEGLLTPVEEDSEIVFLPVTHGG
jgi:molybdopterin converting factor small subunit